MAKIVKVPKVFQELHGETTSLPALLGTYSSAIVFALVCFLLTRNLEDPAARVVILLMSLDIGGGAIANLTRGTSVYYESRPGLRWLFILVHLGNAALFYLFLPGDSISLLIIGISIVAASAGINLFRHKPFSKWLSGLLVLAVPIASWLLKLEPASVVLLTVFAFKLIFAFNLKVR
jgi:hypothetical protein